MASPATSADVSMPAISAEQDQVRKLHIVPTTLPVAKLECRTAWEGLTEKEKKYVHYFSRASWAGAKICPQQLSQESPLLLEFLVLLFGCQPVGALKEASTKAGVFEEDWKSFMAFSACVMANLGNYLSFGDSKIVPGLLKEHFHTIVKSSQAEGEKKQKLESLWTILAEKIYSLEAGERELGFAPKGITAYYSEGITREEVEVVQEWMSEVGLEAWNTRVFRVQYEDADVSMPQFELRVASAEAAPVKTYTYKDKCIIRVMHGDFAPELKEVVKYLEEAKKYVENETQEKMLQEYILHFKTGGIEHHKASQRYWIKDKGPVVETNIGFIESYRDPLGCRAEFEGFVAVVNKSQSAKFAALVSAAEELLSKLPWPREFEKDKFMRPDFTSLEVVAFGSSGIPAGINIPNYDDIRQKEGFKNVSLGNVLSARDSDEKVTFLQDSDQKLFKDLKGQAFEVQVGCHELLGHGSGKLFQREKDGTYNFPYQKLASPLSGDVITSCYLPGQTWDSVFGTMSSTYEECRAECVGIYLCTNQKVLSVFGHAGSSGDDIVYVNWLLMVRAGLLALEFYSPETKQWRQAHMQARYAILRVLLEASESDRQVQKGDPDFSPLVEVAETGEDGITVRLNRGKIISVGVPAIGNFLMKLQVYKSTADVNSAKEMYEKLTAVPEHFLHLRKTVLDKKRPRPIFCQVHTVENSAAPGGIELEEFEASHEGVVQSCVERFGASQ